MSKETIKLYSSRFELSECEADPEVYIGKFVICDFAPNKNGLQIDRDTIENWILTLVDKPLVGKIVTTFDGTKDFSSHNMKLVKKTDDFGNEYEEVEFDTSAFGTFCEVGIEEIDKVECIVATAKIWKRFTEACEVIKSRVENGDLSTSFEITVLKKRVANYMGRPLKIVEQGCFFGHCLLGMTVEGAYESSKLLNVASKKINTDLENALINDIYKIAQKEEEDNLDKKNSVIDTAEVKAPVVAQPVIEPESVISENAEVKDKEIAALTEWELRDKIRDACRAKLGKWCWINYHFPADKVVWVEAEYRESELDYIHFTYTVDNDVVTVSDPTPVKLTVSVSAVNSTVEKLSADISTRDTTIAELNIKLQEMSTEVSNLVPYKEKFEQVEQEKIAQATASKKESLKNKALQSKYVTQEEVETSEEIKTMIENLDENGINRIIAERVIAATSTQKSAKKVETAQVQTQPVVKTNIVDSDISAISKEKITHKEFIQSFIKG